MIVMTKRHLCGVTVWQLNMNTIAYSFPQ